MSKLLRNQVILVKPKIIVLLGSTALKNICGQEYGITASRGNGLRKKEFYICQLGTQRLF